MNNFTVARNLLILVVIMLLLAFGSVACNTMARSLGGIETIDLAPKRKVMSMSWKEADLWIVTRPMKDTEEAEEIHYTEYSNLGMLQGKIIVKESK